MKQNIFSLTRNSKRTYLFIFIFLFSFSLVSSSPIVHQDRTNLYTGNLTNLSEMEDVSIPSPSNNEVLSWSSAISKWVASTITDIACQILGIDSANNEDDLLILNGSNYIGYDNDVFESKVESLGDARYIQTESDPIAYNGTLALNSSLSNYYLNSNPSNFINWSQANNGTFVPYESATSNVNLGDNNFSVGTSDFFVNNHNGNVGIGTTAPGVKLEINTTAGAEGLRLYTSTSGTSPKLRFRDGSGTDTFIYQNDGGDLQFDMEDSSGAMIIERGGNVGIGTTAPNYKLTVGNGSNTNYSLMSAYFEGNISSAGYITRTSIYDKSKGKALDKIKDADEYKTNGKINHSAFYGYTSWMTNETDFARPVIENQVKEVCDEPKCQEVCEDVLNEETQELENKCENKCDEPKCHNETEEVTTYPFTKEVKNEGVSLDSEIDLLRQAVFELKTDNKKLSDRLDKIEIETCTIKLFSWCLK